MSATNRTVRKSLVWMMPAAALALLAGTSNAWAQDSTGFGLSSAANEQASQSSYNSSMASNDDWDAPTTEQDLEDLEGAVDVNEYDLVDLHVNNEDLGNILQLLSIQSQRNIISSNEVSATITADLYGVTFYEALDSILHVNGYGYIEKGNFIYVYTREQIEEIVRANRTRVTRVVSLDYLNSTDAAEFAKQLLSDDGSITTTAATESFAINDSAPTGADNYANTATLVINDYEENTEEILGLLAQLDTKPEQVLVEATILQTSLTEANAFGVDFALVKNLNFSDFIGTGGPMNVVNSLLNGAGQTVDGTDVDVTGSDGVGVNSGPGNTGGPATLKAGIVNGDVAVFMRVLDEVTDVTVVSNPKILTLNRQPARVLVGTRVGYLNTTTTETSTTQTVEFLDVGTQLAVRPFVSKNGLIRLELRPQVSSFTLREVTDNSGSAVTIPDEDTTEMTTNVMVRDGQTVVLGGLFTETTSSARRQVPLLGDIPLIGNAFKGYDDATRRSEIIFLITPSIVNDTALAEAGELGNQYVEQARFGSRKALLPWSRERRIGQLLIDASNLADRGETELALAKIDRALRLNPMSPDARQMRSEISGATESMPSRSMLEDVMGEIHGGEIVQGQQPATAEFVGEEFASDLDETPVYEEFEPEIPAGVESEIEGEVFAEVPAESVSDASGTDSQFYEEWTSDDQEVYSEVEVAETQYDFVDDNDYAEFSDEEFAPSVTAESTTESGWVTSEPVEVPAASTAIYTEVPVDSAFGETAHEVASNEVAAESFTEWSDVPEFDQPATEFTQETGIAISKYSGVLIIPLPGGGALQLDWPMSVNDWSGSSFTSVPTDAGIEEISE
ncbi:MAG: hypothetical protein KC996_07320 [Phycisphaerales bacterium]|nr:hypothetical protein [Phycisphaerales bacterium]